MDYGPSPERCRPRPRLAGARRLRPFHRRRLHQARRDLFRRDQPRHGRGAGAGQPGQRARTSTPPSPPRARREGLGGAAGPPRARISMRLARHDAEARPLFAVLETLDNGKPIRESRDIDMPLAIRHFYHHAGWAELVAEEFPGQAPAWRLRPDHPVELSAADAGLEGRAGAGGRQHGGAEARRIHAADRASVRRDLPRGRAAAGRGQHRHRRRRDRGGAGRSSGVDKIAFTGSTEVGRASARPRPARARR
jgi:aldehyde dehydrogenase (NAD+)